MATKVLILIVCVSVHAFIQIGAVVSTESLLFDYNGSTLAECQDHFQLEFSPNCTKVCPPFAPFRFHNLCLGVCPRGLTANSYSTCSSSYYELPSVERDKVPNLKCKKEYKYELTSPQGTVCYKRCPKGTFGDEKKCSYTCSGKKLQLESEHTCVTRCPDTHPLRDNSTEAKCVQSCREGLLEWTENKMCIASEKCDTKQAFYNYNNEKCVRNCPGISFPSFQGKECVLITKDYLIPVVVLLIIGTGSLLFLCIFCCRKSQRHHIENKNDIERSEENPPQFDDGYSSEETVLKSNEDNSSGSADNMQRLSLQQSHSSVIIPLRNMQTEELIDDSSKERQPISTSYSTDTDETCVKFV
ncbi:uncharacterized protein LOC110449353 isoform X2 [Mizuhopecten yessoensis]|uniref:uncharacterized protein LOC110449353 isoform X2 n=1 Tax=Mizuhopecten yessoensis TaxID=6573 RepID=UPI000B45BF7A|nr:uncharacterized protein LOC110449353 isoform X2 [Mizuhopecten yessoensis]